MVRMRLPRYINPEMVRIKFVLVFFLHIVRHVLVLDWTNSSSVVIIHSCLIHLQGLKPYSSYQSMGYRLLNCVAKGRFADTDIYWAHADLPVNDKTDLLMLTNK